MSTANDLPGFEVPLHRSLTEPILLWCAAHGRHCERHAGRRRGLGLQLWIPGVVLWIVGHSLAVWARVSIRSSCRSSPGTSHKPLLDV